MNPRDGWESNSLMKYKDFCQYQILEKKKSFRPHIIPKTK